MTSRTPPGAAQPESADTADRAFALAGNDCEVCVRALSGVDESGGAWTLPTGHGHVLVEITRTPDARICDISSLVSLNTYPASRQPCQSSFLVSARDLG
jgi:hypothetical protein